MEHLFPEISSLNELDILSHNEIQLVEDQLQKEYLEEWKMKMNIINGLLESKESFIRLRVEKNNERRIYNLDQVRDGEFIYSCYNCSMDLKRPNNITCGPNDHWGCSSLNLCSIGDNEGISHCVLIPRDKWGYNSLSVSKKTNLII